MHTAKDSSATFSGRQQLHISPAPLPAAKLFFKRLILGSLVGVGAVTIAACTSATTTTDTTPTIQPAYNTQRVGGNELLLSPAAAYGQNRW